MAKLFIHTIFCLFSILLMNCNSSKSTEDNSSSKEITQDSCCKKDTIESSTQVSETSEITCPKCGYKKTETLPTEVCLIKYTCDSCSAISYSKDGDCCVFCSYGTHKCPSKQEN